MVGSTLSLYLRCIKVSYVLAIPGHEVWPIKNVTTIKFKKLSEFFVGNTIIHNFSYTYESFWGVTMFSETDELDSERNLFMREVIPIRSVFTRDNFPQIPTSNSFLVQ